MVQFRVVFSERVNDVQLFRLLGERVRTYIREAEPGTTVYNWFISDGGHFLNEDRYADDAAFLRHIKNAQAQGFYTEFLAVTEVETIQVLGDAGAQVLEALAGFSPRSYRGVGEL